MEGKLTEEQLEVPPDHIRAALTLSRFATTANGESWDCNTWVEIFCRLKPREQYILYCKIFLRMSWQEIADDLGMKRQTPQSSWKYIQEKIIGIVQKQRQR